MAEMTVRIEGSILGATGISSVVTTTGSVVANTTLTAQSATGPGVVADFGSGKQNITLVTIGTAGVSAGAVALEVSQDGVNWYQLTPTTIAPGVKAASSAGFTFRYARGNVTTAITGGTVTATLMAA